MILTGTTLGAWSGPSAGVEDFVAVALDVGAVGAPTPAPSATPVGKSNAPFELDVPRSAPTPVPSPAPFAIGVPGTEPPTAAATTPPTTQPSEAISSGGSSSLANDVKFIAGMSAVGVLLVALFGGCVRNRIYWRRRRNAAAAAAAAAPAPAPPAAATREPRTVAQLGFLSGQHAHVKWGLPITPESSGSSMVRGGDAAVAGMLSRDERRLLAAAESIPSQRYNGYFAPDNELRDGIDLPRKDGGGGGAKDGGVNVAQAVMNTAQALAQRSMIPGVSEAAGLAAVLAQLAVDNKSNPDDLYRRLRWCTSLLDLLDGAQKVLGKVSQHTKHVDGGVLTCCYLPDKATGALVEPQRTGERGPDRGAPPRPPPPLPCHRRSPRRINTQ